MASFPSSLLDPDLFVSGVYINGQWQSKQDAASFEVLNPASNQVIGACPESTVADVQTAIQAASAVVVPWKALSGRQRSRLLRRVFEQLLQHRLDLAAIITAENGKSKADALAEVDMAANYFEWFAEEAPRVYGDVVAHSNPALRTQIVKTPIGVCGLITPWNFPLAMGARKIAAALAAGCTVVLKSDGVTSFSSNALAVLLHRAGAPPGVVNVITATVNTPAVGLALCESPTVKKISFTGSTRVGKLLMRQCSSTLKKLSLEVGGNAAFIVFNDADLDVAISNALISKFKVTGQTCVCANRFFVQEDIYDAFSEALVRAVRKYHVGNGNHDSTTHGPLTCGTAKARAHLNDAVAKGAVVLEGGHLLPSMGHNFHELTVLGNVTDDMLVMREETFGPIAALSKFSSEKEVIQRANDCDVGLAFYIMTKDLDRACRVSEALEVDMVAINTAVISDSATPFGGVKESGFGREGSKYGLEDYLVMKSVITAVAKL